MLHGSHGFDVECLTIGRGMRLEMLAAASSACDQITTCAPISITRFGGNLR